jgi:hypothetical protein
MTVERELSPSRMPCQGLGDTVDACERGLDNDSASFRLDYAACQRRSKT